MLPRVHILSLDIYGELMMALSADVSLLLTLNPDSVDTDTDSTGGPEMVQNASSTFGFRFYFQLSWSAVKGEILVIIESDPLLYFF